MCHNYRVESQLKNALTKERKVKEMGIPVGLKKHVRWNYGFLVFAAFIFLYISMAAAGDLMSTICNNQVVSVGDRKGEVSAKCGKPLSSSQDTVETRVSQTMRKKTSDKKQAEKDKTTIKKKTVKERAETWTYNIDGSYRFFIFKGGKLSKIETGGLAN
jgi:hypothetical protein